MDTCIVYIARTRVDPIPNAELFLINDRDTRSRAKALATGIRVIAGPLMLEVIEAPMRGAELLLDEACESDFWDEPEIVLTIPITKHAFTSWSMLNTPPIQDQPSTIDSIRSLAAQAQNEPKHLSRAIKQMILCFQQTKAVSHASPLHPSSYTPANSASLKTPRRSPRTEPNNRGITHIFL